MCLATAKTISCYSKDICEDSCDNEDYNLLLQSYLGCVLRQLRLYPATARISTTIPVATRIIACYCKAIDDASCDS